MLNRRMPIGMYWWCERGEKISPTRSKNILHKITMILRGEMRGSEKNIIY